MKKKTMIRIVSYAAAAVAVFAGYMTENHRKLDRYRLELENEYASAVCELNAALNNIAEVSEKIGYIGSPSKLSALASKLYCEAELAKSALSRLPSDAGELTRVGLFLSQVGNYALSVSNDLIESGTVTAQQTENFLTLSKTAQTVAAAIDDWGTLHNNPDYWSGALAGAVPAQGVTTLGSTLSETEESLEDYPTLIYDGPYSEHILDKNPLMLENAAAVGEREARKTAEQVLPASGTLRYLGKTQGRISEYCYERGGVTVAVSERGGYLVYLRSDRPVGEASLDYPAALAAARPFLQPLLDSELRETYYFTADGVCVINFACVQDEILCYTDLVKVGVALDTGEIVLYEASGYLFNHTARSLDMPAYTQQQAREVLSAQLTPGAAALALIPTDGGGESLCYEFHCTGRDGRELLVYINAATLNEEQIYILLKTDGGTLVR